MDFIYDSGDGSYRPTFYVGKRRRDVMLIDVARQSMQRDIKKWCAFKRNFSNSQENFHLIFRDSRLLFIIYTFKLFISNRKKLINSQEIRSIVWLLYWLWSEISVDILAFLNFLCRRRVCLCLSSLHLGACVCVCCGLVDFIRILKLSALSCSLLGRNPTSNFSKCKLKTPSASWIFSHISKK